MRERGARRGRAGRSPAAASALLAVLSLAWAHGVPGQPAPVTVGPNVHVSAGSSGLVHVEPAVAASPTDARRLVAASMIVRDPHSRDFQDSWGIAVYASRDGGRSWSRRPLPGLPEDWMAGDVWLTWSDDDVVYLSCVATRSMLGGEPVETRVYRSTDGGWSWSGPERWVFGPERSQDHPVLSAATGPDGSPVVYAFGTIADEREAEGVDLAVVEAGSHEFRPLEPYTVDRRTVNLGDGAALPGGGFVFTYFRMPDPPRGLWAVQGDGTGERREVEIRPAILPVGFPMVAVDRSGGDHHGRVYAAWVEGADARDQRDLRVLVASSDDGGRSWSDPTPAHRHEAPTRRTMPFVAVSGEGVVAVSWMDWRNSPNRSDCPELFVSVSTDGGESFRPEVRVSSQRSCFGTPANGAAARRWSLGGGEYLGMAAAADGSFQLVWPDSRTGRFQAWTATVRVP